MSRPYYFSTTLPCGQGWRAEQESPKSPKVRLAAPPLMTRQELPGKPAMRLPMQEGDEL